eukprot:4566426-Ditylum_brightwellii.AAC.1
MHLPFPLRRWCQPSLLLQQDWPLYFDYEDYLLYIRTFNGYTEYYRNVLEGDIFHCPEPTNWVPTSMCIAIGTMMSDGAHTWQSEGCSGIV